MLLKKIKSIVFIGILSAVPCLANADLPQSDFQYSIEGLIRSIPKDNQGVKELIIQHEAVPDYRDETGKVVGMHAMTMPFYLAEELPIEGLKAGDRVKFKLEAWQKPRFKELITQIEVIPNS